MQEKKNTRIGDLLSQQPFRHGCGKVNSGSNNQSPAKHGSRTHTPSETTTQSTGGPEVIGGVDFHHQIEPNPGNHKG